MNFDDCSQTHQHHIFLGLFYREGKGEASRTRLVDRLQQFIPPNIMLPPRRLKTLLKQAVEMQADRCSCHDVAWTTDLDNISLLVDHQCGIDTVSWQTVGAKPNKEKFKIVRPPINEETILYMKTANNRASNAAIIIY